VALLFRAGSGKEIKGVPHFLRHSLRENCQPTRKRQCHELDRTPDYYSGVIHCFNYRTSSVRRILLMKISGSQRSIVRASAGASLFAVKI
jgi:hypothetical protein